MGQLAIGTLSAAAVVWCFAPRTRPVAVDAERVIEEPAIIEIAEIKIAEDPPKPKPRRPAPPAPKAPPPTPEESATARDAEEFATANSVPKGLEESATADSGHRAGDLTRGRALLASGTFPRLRASYANLGFERYRDAMLDLGAGFYLFDFAARQPIASVDPTNGTTSPPELSDRLSRWPRDVTRHTPELLESGQREFGPAVSRVILLPPVDVDAALLGALERYLTTRELEPRELARVDVIYTLVGKRLHCDVLALAMRDGTEIAADLQVDLSRGSLS